MAKGENTEMASRKSVRFTLLFLGLMLITVLFRVSSVRGESVYTAEYNYKTKTLTVTNRQGSYVASLYMKGYSLNNQIAADSSRTVIYFTTYYGDRGDYCYLYQYNIPTRQYSLLAKLPNGYFSYDVKELYDGSLYLNGWNPSDNIAMFRYKLNDHSLQKIADVGYVDRYRQKIIMDVTYVMGSFSPYPLSVYNTKTNKVTRIAKKCGGWSRAGQWVYFAKLNGSSRGPAYSYSIKKYSLTTKKTKTFLKKLNAFSVGRITTSKIYYNIMQPLSGSQAYVCSLKGNGKKKISMLKYSQILEQNRKGR